MKASNPPKDKRTKAYKEWKAKYDNQSKGLGDTVKKVFEKTGVSKAVKFIAGEDCGCKERQNKMNKIFTYQRPECLNEEEYNLIRYLRRKYKHCPNCGQQLRRTYGKSNRYGKVNRCNKGKAK